MTSPRSAKTRRDGEDHLRMKTSTRTKDPRTPVWPWKITAAATDAWQEPKRQLWQRSRLPCRSALPADRTALANDAGLVLSPTVRTHETTHNTALRERCQHGRGVAVHGMGAGPHALFRDQQGAFANAPTRSKCAAH